MAFAGSYSRRLHLPLAVQIVGLLLAGLIVAQLTTLVLTLLWPPKPAPRYQLNDIAEALKGGAVNPRGDRALVRTIRPRPPSLHSVGWLVSEQSKQALAKLVGADPADVRLLFYSPLPFAGTTPIMPQPSAKTGPFPISLSASSPSRVAFQRRIVQASILPSALFNKVVFVGPPGGGGFPHGGGFPSDGFPGGRFPGSGYPGNSFPGNGSSGGRTPSTNSPGGDVSSSSATTGASSSITPGRTNADGASGATGSGTSLGPAASPGSASHSNVPTVAGTVEGSQAAAAGGGISAPSGAPLSAPSGAPSGVPATGAPQGIAPTGAGGVGSGIAAGTQGGPASGPPSSVSLGPRMSIPTPSPPSTQRYPDPPVSPGRAAAAPQAHDQRVVVNQSYEANVAASTDARDGLTPSLASAANSRRAASSSANLAASEWVLPATPTRGLFGLAPAPFVQGDFVAAVRLTSSEWITVQPSPEPFLNSWQRRILLWFAVSFSVVGPVGYLFARRLAAPLEDFAVAAERLGRDPAGAVLTLRGPAEIGRAAAAFNLMQLRLKSYIDDRTGMVGAISHDLRTPLARMRFRIEHIPAAMKPGMLNDVSQMEEMISSVLVFIRDASEPSARERIDLRSIVECVVDEAAMVGGVAQLDAGAPSSVEVDSLGVKRVITNLVENALKYGERANVRIFTKGNEAVTEVSDNGPGLPDTEIERVFQPFYRAVAARTLAKGGIGLGLAVSRSIARAHGGDVRLRNGDQGLVAQLRLPLAPPVTEP